MWSKLISPLAARTENRSYTGNASGGYELDADLDFGLDVGSTSDIDSPCGQ